MNGSNGKAGSWQEHIADLVPVGALPVLGIRAVLFVDQEGVQHYAVAFTAGAPPSAVLGLLELAKAEALRGLES